MSRPTIVVNGAVCARHSFSLVDLFMTIIFSQDPTGPTPYEHEILQIGAVFATDDLEEVLDRFGCYIRPDNIEDIRQEYISRTGIPGKDWMDEKAFGEPHEKAWTHFRDVASRHGDSLTEARLLCFDAAYDAPFLRHSIETVDATMPPITRFIGGIVQATVDVASYFSYLGGKPDVLKAIQKEGLPANAVRREVFQYYDVSCTRITDAVRRADAIRHSYRALFRKLSDTNGSSANRSSKSRSRGSSNPTVRRR